MEKVVGTTRGNRNRAYVIALIRKALYFARDKRRYLPETHRNLRPVEPRPRVGSGRSRSDTQESPAFGVTLAAMEKSREVSPWLANLFGFPSSAG